jgi:hypothetical protein
VAPPSGKVIVWHSVSQLNESAASSVLTTVRVRTGGTVGSGSDVLAASDNYAIWTDPSSASNNIVTASTFVLVQGLTPGSTYNVQQLHRMGTSGNIGDFSRRRVMVQPTI